MGRKMKFPFLFKTQEEGEEEEEEEEEESTTAATSWPWPSCRNPKTLSFRAPGGDIFKTINSAYDTATEEEDPEELDSAAAGGGGDPVEAVISGLRTAPERLFFEPGETSSILGESSTSKSNNNDDDEGKFRPEKEEQSSSRSTELVAMDSMDPYVDFKISMEEMVEAHGLKEWAGLEELLGWYLKANGKENHGYIVGAFVDLVVGLTLITTTSSSSSSSSSSPSSSEDDHRDRSFSVLARSTACSLNSPPLSFSSSITCSSSSTSSTCTPCLSSLEAEDDINKQNSGQ